MLVIINVPWEDFENPFEKAKESKKISQNIASELQDILGKCRNLVEKKWVNYSIDKITLNGSTSIKNIEIEFSKNKDTHKISLLKDDLLSK